LFAFQLNNVRVPILQNYFILCFHEIKVVKSLNITEKLTLAATLVPHPKSVAEV